MSGCLWIYPTMVLWRSAHHGVSRRLAGSVAGVRSCSLAAVAGSCACMGAKEAATARSTAVIAAASLLCKVTWPF